MYKRLASLSQTSTITEKREEGGNEIWDSPHHPSTPAERFPSSLCSAATLNQYNPLIGPGTLRRTSTSRSRENAVNPREMAGWRSDRWYAKVERQPIFIQGAMGWIDGWNTVLLKSPVLSFRLST